MIDMSRSATSVGKGSSGDVFPTLPPMGAGSVVPLETATVDQGCSLNCKTKRRGVGCENKGQRRDQ